MLLGERCATQMMSHPVTLPSSLSPSAPSSPATRLTRQTRIARTCCRTVRGAHERCHFILSSHAPLPLTETSNHYFPKSSRHHINRYALADVSLPCCLRHLFFPYLTRVLSSSVHIYGIQMGLFLYSPVLNAVMEYDTLVIFPGPGR